MAGSELDLLIIGAGPTAVSAARSYRKQGGDDRVALLSADPDAPYERPPLSKQFLRGSATEADLQLLEPGELDQLRVQKLSAEVVGLSLPEHEVRARDGRSFHYRQCLIATGSTPSRLPVPGADDARVLVLRTLADARRLRAAADGAGTAVVIGSGFIGCEAAASLSRLGLRVTLVTDEAAPQQRRLGSAAAERIAGWLAAENVALLPSMSVKSVTHEAITLDDHPEVRADLVVMAVGVQPSTGFAQAAGLATKDGRILTDARMRTTVDGVLAAGDVAMAYNTAAGRPLAVEHWGEALTMGEIAGITAAGGEAQWSNAPGFWSEIGDRTLKYAAWGDGFEQARLQDHGDGAFTVWYTDRSGTTVGVLTHEADDDYERGQSLVEKALPPV